MLKKVLFYCVTIFFFVTFYAAPLKFVPQTLSQPDGTILKCFASGDEYFHWLHDIEGYTIVKNQKTGYWVYAEHQGAILTATNLIPGKIKPAEYGLQKWLMPGKEILESYYIVRKENQEKLYKSLNGNQLSRGTINNIVIFVRFADFPEFTRTVSDYNKFFDGNNETETCFQNYFKSVSYDQLTCKSHFFPKPNGDLILSVVDKHSRKYYLKKEVEPDSGYATTEEGSQRVAQLQKNALEEIGSLIPADLNIDNDNDGKIDNIIFVISGESDGWGNALWPIWSTFDFEYTIHGKSLKSYNLQFDEGMTVSVICHEMFHTLGAPDLYHYKPEAKDLSPVANWDLMESDGNQHMLAYMKMQYGKWFSKIPEITESGTYTLDALSSNDTLNICYKIKSPNSADEYFMLEFRNKNLPFESNVPSTGIIIYRINTTLAGKGNEDGPPDEVYIFRPDGTTTSNGKIQRAAFSPDSGRTAFNDNTNPACFLSDGKPGGINISEIVINGDKASFKVELGETDIEGNKILPLNYSLEQNYPNPFNPSTSISYSIAQNCFVEITVYDLLGREIKKIVKEEKPAGKYQVYFNASECASGILFYTIKAGNYSETKRMVFIK